MDNDRKPSSSPLTDKEIRDYRFNHDDDCFILNEKTVKLSDEISQTIFNSKDKFKNIEIAHALSMAASKFIYMGIRTNSNREDNKSTIKDIEYFRDYFIKHFTISFNTLWLKDKMK